VGARLRVHNIFLRPTLHGFPPSVSAEMEILALKVGEK